eukprot:53459_1
MEIPLNYMPMNENTESIQSNIISLRWFDKLLLYTTCVPISPSHEPRHKCCQIIGSLYSATIILYYVTLIILINTSISFESMFENNQSLHLYSPDDDIYFVMARIFSSVLSVTQWTLSCFYIYARFNFPWNKHSSITSMNYRYNQYYNIFIAIFVFLWFLVMIMGFVVYFASLIFLPIIPFFMMVNFYPFAIQSIICYQYYLNLKSLTLDFPNDSAMKTMQKYKSIHMEFKNDYPFSLKWSVNLIILSNLIYIWIGAYSMLSTFSSAANTNNNLLHFFVSSSGSIIEIIYYSISSCILSEIFEKFQAKIWKQIQQTMDDETMNEIEKSTIQSQYHLLLAFIEKYPVHISFGSLRVTKRNLMKFIVVFIGTKIAAQAIANLY